MDTFKTFTEKENNIRNDKTKNTDDLVYEIRKNTEQRHISSQLLYSVDKEGKPDKSKENEKYQVAIFEGDIVRLALQDRNEEKVDCQLLDEMVYLEIYHNDILQQIIKDGIKIADEEYIVYSATTGQVRDTTATLLKKTFFKKHIGFLLVGLTIDKINIKGGMNVGKYLSYTALPLSSSVLPNKEIDIDRCIVVKGLETIITDKVKYIDIQVDNAGQCYVADIPKDYVDCQHLFVQKLFRQNGITIIHGGQVI